MRTAVFCHIYYPELADELFEYIANIPHPCDLWVNIPSTVSWPDRIRIIESSNRSGCGDNRYFRISENRGRDIGGFLHLLDGARESGRKYDLVAFVHSKAHNGLGANLGRLWRRQLLEPILGSPARVRQIIKWFWQEPKLGMVGADKWVYEESRTGGPELINRTKLHLKRLRKRFEIPETPGRFVAGTIFWARWKPLSEGLAFGNASQEELETLNRRDGLKYHAYETLFGLLMHKAGLTVEGI